MVSFLFTKNITEIIDRCTYVYTYIQNKSFDTVARLFFRSYTIQHNFSDR